MALIPFKSRQTHLNMMGEEFIKLDFDEKECSISEVYLY